MKDKMNIIMLNEFAKQIDEIMLVGNKNEFNFDKIINLINKQKNHWESCRIDLQNKGNDFNEIKVLEPDDNLNINFPSWFRNLYGQGCQIESDVANFNFKFQCVNDGTLIIYLRGVDYKNLNKVRRPIYVNFTNFKINDEVIFDDNKLLCHDQHYDFEISVKDKDIFDIFLEFKTIFDYYPFFLNFFNNVKDMKELNDEYYRFKKQIKYIQFLEYFDEINDTAFEMYDFIDNENQLILENNEKNLFSYNSFLNHYTNYLGSFEIKDKFDQLNSKIELLENKIKDYERVIDSNNELFNVIFLNYTLKPNKLLFNVKTLCLELLIFIKKVCEKYDIDWWLDYGTLLGSVRHENFIPWDDDIDIGMMRKDYHDFIEVLYDELEKNNLTNYIDVGYRWRKYHGIVVNSFLQFYIRDEEVGNNILLAGADVFPYDFMEDYDSRTFGDSYNVSKSKFYQTLCNGSDFSTLYMGLDYSEIIDNYYNGLNLTYAENKYIIPGVEGAFGYKGTNIYELIFLEYADIFPLKKSKFMECDFPVPNKSNVHLKKVYGDYMKVPKVVRTHNRLNSLRDVPNINSILEKYINILKEANNNFQF